MKGVSSENSTDTIKEADVNIDYDNLHDIYFAGGCFWGVEEYLSRGTAPRASASVSAEMDERLLYFQGNVGAVSSPFDAYLTARGIKTLSVRMDRHCSNAQAVAEFLESRPEVKQVLYPGLPSHPGHELAKKQMRDFGGMMSVRFHDAEHAKQVCLNTQLVALAESLGGVESLIEHPQNMTHISAEGSELVPPEDLVRISIGIEDVADLIADFEQALDALH